VTGGSIFAVLAALSGAAAGGYAVVRLFAAGLSRAEKVAWSVACGMLLSAGLSALLMATGLLPGPKKFAAGLLAVGAASALALRPGRSPASVPAKKAAPVATKILSAVSYLAVALFALEAARGGMWSTDHVAIWGFRAKTMFETGTIPHRLFDDPAIAFSNPRYPLLVPLSLSSFAAALRAWDEHALALLYPLLQLATVLLVSGFLSRRVSAVSGAFGGLLVSLCAGLYKPANVGTADIPMALGFALAATAWLDLREHPDSSATARLFVGSLFCAATKSEGSLFVLFLFVASLPPVIRHRRVPLRESVAMMLPMALHAGALQLIRGHVADRAVDWSLIFSGNVVELLPRVREVLARIVTVELVAAAAPLACLAALWLVSARGPADPLSGPLVLQILAYAAACVLSAFDPIWQVDSAFARITLALFPLVALIAGARLPALRATASMPRS